MPGYGFSGKPTAAGWGPDDIARAWVVLMKRLGYAKFVAQGGDWGAIIGDVMAAQGHPELIGIHTNLPNVIPPDIDKAAATGNPAPARLSPDEKRAYKTLSRAYKNNSFGDFMESRPQTLYGIADSPVGLAAWLLDHDDARGQPAAAIASALNRTTSATGELTRDEVLDNIATSEPAQEKRRHRAVIALGQGVKGLGLAATKAVEQFGLDDRMKHVSTGGGAFLEYVEGTPFKALAEIDER